MPLIIYNKVNPSNVMQIRPRINLHELHLPPKNNLPLLPSPLQEPAAHNPIKPVHRPNNERSARTPKIINNPSRQLPTML